MRELDTVLRWADEVGMKIRLLPACAAFGGDRVAQVLQLWCVVELITEFLEQLK